jgi:antibiotic biosynthesis monooxygenase (ABM) superfamily enzyme
MPTVIVARTVLPGRERDFERWFARLRAAAAGAPGFVAADVQTPDGLHPQDWVIVYQFTDSGTLAAWLSSPERAALMTEGAELVSGPAREQVVALAPQTDPVTAVSSVRVRPGNEAGYRALHEEMLAEIQTFEGFLRSDLFEPVEGVQADTVVVFAFDSREHLDRWLRSGERRAILHRMEPYVEGLRTLNIVGGFAGWFPPPGAPSVKRWKQAAVVLLALFPITLSFGALRNALLPDLDWVLGVFLGNLIGVALLSWVLMPFLTRLLSGWLRR